MLGASALAGEESGHTVEFLLSHPVPRTQIVLEKLLCVLVQVLILNAVCSAVGILSFLFIEETPDLPVYMSMHLCQWLMQTEIACICFCLSSFLHRSSTGAAIGLTAVFYCLNLLSNLSSKLDVLHLLTPDAYTEVSPLLNGSGPEWPLILIGIAVGAASAAVAWIHYLKKDISI